MRRAWGLAAILLLRCAYSATGQDADISGYWKSFFSATDVRDTGLGGANSREEDYWLDLTERLRVRVRAGHDRPFSAGADYELFLQWGDTTEARHRTSPAAPKGVYGAFPVRSRLMDLDKSVVDEESVTVTHGLDRLWGQWEPGSQLRLTVGRQAVSWGTGMIWAPLDLFAAFSPTEIDREEKLGVDVVRLFMQVLPNVSLDVVGEPLKLEEPWSARRDDSSLAMRLGSHAGEYDLHLVAGVIQSDVVLGADFAGYLGGAGFRGELVRTLVEESDQRDYTRGVVNIDYGFAAPWNPYVAIEYFHNGLGVSDESGYIDRLGDSSVERVFARGIAYNIGRDYLGLILRVQPSFLVSLQAATLANLHDGSLREFATVSWSLSQDFELVAGMDIGFGSDDGEFTGRSDPASGATYRLPNLGFLYGKYYF